MNDIIYGRNIVLEALRSGRVEKIFLVEGTKGAAARLRQEALARGIPLSPVTRQELDRLTKTDAHQGVAAQVTPFRYVGLEEIMAAAQERGEAPLLLILDCVQDPQNLGTLLRTAEAAGAHGVIIPKHRAVGVTPAVEKASAGAVEHLRIAQVTNLRQSIDRLKDKGIWVAGVEDVPEATPYWLADLTGPLALVVGSEGRGISRLVRQSCDFMISLPMRGKVTSLNAAVAGSIVLYEAMRQRIAGGLKGR